MQSGFGGRFGGYTAHFHMEWTSNSQDNVYLFDDNKIELSLNETKGILTGAVIQTTSAIVEMFVGISYVSIENAVLNLKTEVPVLSWETVF